MKMKELWLKATQGELKQYTVAGLPRNILRTFKDPAAPSFTFVLHIPKEKLSMMSSTFEHIEGYIVRTDWMQEQPILVVVTKDKNDESPLSS